MGVTESRRMTGGRRLSKSKITTLSLKNLKKTETERGGDDPGVIVCVGSTGTGKSSTIARVTGAEVKSGAGPDPVTEQCQLYPGHSGQVWVDTVGWEDRQSDNLDTFQETLSFLNDHDLLTLAAIVWCVSPNIKQD